MHRAYFISDRAIQIDWNSGQSPIENSLPAWQLATFRQHLLKSIQTLDWPACQCVQADQSITLLFQNSIFASRFNNGLHGWQSQALIDQINRILSTLPSLNQAETVAQNTGCHHQIAVNYGGVAGQDLDWLAMQSSLSPVEIIKLHSSATYTVQFLGFLPGFAYLSGLPKQLQFARRETPRARVPAGTLAIGAHYCAVYPWESPGGWHLLGHVEQVLFDPERTDQQGQSIFKAGDTVQFIQADYA